jgi:hypothetical protein
MSRSKRSLEGLATIDHRDSPGIPDSLAVPNGLPVGTGKGFHELPTFSCSHCQAVVMMNPLRTRERAYCTGCDRYLCDRCGAARAAGVQCKPFLQLIDEMQERDVRALQRGSIILPT